MAFMPFAMERWMFKFEQKVDYNLSESGVHPVKLSKLLDRVLGLWKRPKEIEPNYPHVNGIPELRERIAARYPGATPENVLVTVGTAEANFIIATTLAGPGDSGSDAPQHADMGRGPQPRHVRDGVPPL